MSNFSITAWTTHPYMTNLLVIMEVVRYECYTCMRYVVHILWKVRCGTKSWTYFCHINPSKLCVVYSMYNLYTYEQLFSKI